MKSAMLFERLIEDKKVKCNLCYHNCRISDGKFGICNVRQNQGGDLYTLAYGKAIAANVDPIEKKPLYHFLPGTYAFSVGTAGCNFKCSFCQNWQISQAAKSQQQSLPGNPLSPAEIVEAAIQRDCRSIAYTYTEPTIFFEYAYDTARLAHERGLKNVFVSNGYMTEEALKTIKPWLDAINIDLKAMSNAFYKNMCQARLQPVLDNIRRVRDLGIWLEVTTLIVPGANDHEKELQALAEFIAGVDPDIPWHISRFHPDYQYTDTPATPLSVLQTAFAIGKEAGLKYIYMGNVPNADNDTRCPQCHHPVIQRKGNRVEIDLDEKHQCSECGTPISGVYG